MLVLAYYAAVIFGAYRIGQNNAGAGIVLFITAVALHQVVADGPASFLGGECQSYGHAARDC